MHIRIGHMDGLYDREELVMRICQSLRDAFAIAIGLCCLSVLAIQPARAQKSPRDMPVYKVDPF